MKFLSRNTNAYFILATLIAILPVVLPFFIPDIIEADRAWVMFLMIYTWVAGFVVMVLGISAFILARKEKRTIWVGIVILLIGLLWSVYIIKEVLVADL